MPFPIPTTTSPQWIRFISHAKFGSGAPLEGIPPFPGSTANGSSPFVTPSQTMHCTSCPVPGISRFSTRSHTLPMIPKVYDLLIKSDKVVIFSKTGCAQSQEAKRLFDDIKQKYTSIELDRRDDGHMLQSHLGCVTGSMLTPRVFICGRFIGGACELKELHECGELVKLLKQL